MSKKKVITREQLDLISKSKDIIPHCTDKSIFYYLINKKYINMSYSAYTRLLASYKKQILNDNKEDKTYKKLNTLEIEFVELVNFLKNNVVNRVRERFYIGATKDPKIAKDWLDRYDKELKINNAKIKAKEFKTVNQNNFDNIINLANLLNNPQEPNKLDNESS